MHLETVLLLKLVTLGWNNLWIYHLFRKSHLIDTHLIEEHFEWTIFLQLNRCSANRRGMNDSLLPG